MSKSSEYVLSVFSDPTRSDYGDRCSAKIHEYQAEDFYNQYVSNSLRFKVDCDGLVHRNVEISFDQDAKYDYCVTQSYCGDGTLAFEVQAIVDVFKRMIYAQTFCKSVGTGRNGDTIRYICGDVIVLVEYGNYGTEEKQWLSERVTVAVPVKLEIISR